MKIYDEQEPVLKANVFAAQDVTNRPEISVFLPVFNEEPNLVPLHNKLDEALKT